MKRQEIVEYLNAILMDEDPELAQFVYSSNGFEERVDYNGINIINEDSDYLESKTEYEIVVEGLESAIYDMTRALQLLQEVGPPVVEEPIVESPEEKIIRVVKGAIKDGAFDRSMLSLYALNVEL